eukprot:g4595.t1
MGIPDLISSEGREIWDGTIKEDDYSRDPKSDWQNGYGIFCWIRISPLNMSEPHLMTRCLKKGAIHYLTVLV